MRRWLAVALATFAVLTLITLVPPPTMASLFVEVPANAQPDLVVTGASGNMAGYTGGCVARYGPLALRVCVSNQGTALAGAFTVRTDGCAPALDIPFGPGLGPGQTQCNEGAATPQWLTTCYITADFYSQVNESNEGNNTWSDILPIPTPPPTCSPTRTVTPTPTAGPSIHLTAQSPGTVEVDQAFLMDIIVDPAGLPLDGVQVFLSFDPAYLVVVDAAGNPTTTIIAGSTFDTHLLNAVSNTMGLIDYADGQLMGQPVSQTFTLASIRFKAKAATSGTSISFSTQLPRQTKITWNTGSIVPFVSGSVVTIVSPLTPTSTATPTPQGYRVSGHVAEFPTCMGSMRGVQVSLDGRATQTSINDGTFIFENVPNGTYSISIFPVCNPYGCYSVTQITVAGADVNVNICPQPIVTVTPTWTATPQPTHTFTPTHTSTAQPTPTFTPTSYPEPPELLTPAEGATLPQPVAPGEWYFSWITRPNCSRALHIEAPDRTINQWYSPSDMANEYRYSTTEYVADGPGQWWVEIFCLMGSARSETRHFTVSPPPTPTPTLTPTLCPMPTPEPLWVDPVTSPTDLLTQTITVTIGHGEAVTVTAESGIFAVSGNFDSSPAYVQISLLLDTTHHLEVQGKVRTVSQGGCIYGGYTLTTRNDRFGAPLTIVQRSGIAWRVHLPLILLAWSE